MAKSSNKWLERYTDGGLYIPLEGTSYVVRQQISKPRTYGDGGKYLTVNGEYHRVYENAEGDIMVNHPKENKGKWDTINLTQKAKAKTIAQGIAATKKWHRENPEYANGGLNNQDPPVESLRSATTYSVTPQSNATYPIIPQNSVPIKWDAKTQKEIELLQKSINERTKNTPEFKQARKLTKEEQDYSDKVKARIENPSADLGILAANMASALTRLKYLTPDEIKKITNNPKGTIKVAADILEQGLTNELTGGALTALSKAAPQAIESVGKYLTEGPLKNMHKLNPWALTESKIVPEGTVARQIYGDEAFKNFQKYGPTTTPGISEAEQLVEFAKAPTSEIRFRNGEIVNVASTMNKHGFQYPYFSEGKLWFTPEQAKYFGGKERIITTPSSEVFRPAGEASVMMGNPSKEAIEQYARSRRILMPGTEYANPSKYDVYERDWLQGFKKVSERKQSTTFNLQNRRSKPKSIMYKHNEIVEDPNFNIEKIYRGNKETPKVIRVKGKSGEWTVNRANDGSYYFNAAMSNPLESGKAMLKINEMLPPKPVILEPNSLSLDSYLNTIKLGKRPHWKMEFKNYIPLNHSATNNQTLSNMFGFKPENTYVPFTSLEDANVALKEVNAMLKKQGIKHEADVFSNGDGWYGIKIPNFKLTRDYENGGWLNQYEQGGYADDSAVLNSEGQEVNTMQFALPTVPTFNFGNGNGNGDGDGEDPKDKKKSKDKKTDTRTIGQKRHDALEAAKTKILKTESPENKKKMDMLYSTTMAAENTYGYDSKAYGRKKQTRSPMSIDNIALDELFNPKGEKNRYTLQQKSNFNLLRSLGLPTDKAKLKELLETDDAYAGLGVAKTLYYNEGALKNLPNPTDTAAYINLYLDEYNKKGALKYQKRNELIDNITNKMRAQGKRETKTIKPVVKNKTTK